MSKAISVKNISSKACFRGFVSTITAHALEIAHVALRRAFALALSGLSQRGWLMGCHRPGSSDPLEACLLLLSFHLS